MTLTVAEKQALIARAVAEAKAVPNQEAAFYRDRDEATLPARSYIKAG